MMRWLGALVLLGALCAAPTDTRRLDETYDFQGQTIDIDFYTEQPQTETVVIVDAGLEGSIQITGMTQEITLDTLSAQFSDRPQTSFLDLSWTNWVDQRMAMLDFLQEILNPVPRCPHMQGNRGSFDTGMVSYLASSRFGPAILTTYAEKFQEEIEDDFDYEEVYIPEGESLSKSYEDASLLDDLSADVDKAFQQADHDRMLSQQSGFFGANVKARPDQMIYLTQIDGEPESLQPSIRSVPQLEQFELEQSPSSESDSFGWDFGVLDAQQIAGFGFFVLLCVGCFFVWVSLLRSCCKMGRELRASRRMEKAAALKSAQAELLAPLMPEGAKSKSGVEFASSNIPQGVYYASQGDKYVTVAVPLINGEFK